MHKGSSPVVLVIEDDKALGQALSNHLRFRGDAVESVGTGGEGLSRLQAGGVDVVLCDIGLPDMSGHDVVRQALSGAEASAEGRPEFVMMTANPTLDNAIASLELGAFQFVTKPLSMPFLEVVIDRALSFRAARRESRRLQEEQEALVLSALADVTGNLGLVGALESVLRALHVLLRPAHAAIWLADPDEGSLRCVTSRDDASEALSNEHEIIARECFGAECLVCREIDRMHYGAAPIQVDDATEGAISIDFDDECPIDDGSRAELLTTLARFAGNAVRKERLYAGLEQSSMQISSLFEVGLAMSSEVSLQRLFEVIVDSAARISGADRCSLMLIDPGQETLRMRAAVGIPPEVVAKAEARVGEGIAGTVAKTGEPLFISNIEQSGRFQRKNASERYNNTSLVCVPIRMHNRVVGVLNVNNKRDGTSFNENDLNLLTLLASQAAVALDNAHRYQDLSEKAITDGLTGVYLRRYFDECLERADRNARSTGRAFSLLMVDIDHFKRVNDNYGHQTGDEALKVVANILKGLVRDDDLVCRYGGEEFVIILARAGRDAAQRVAERVRATVEGHEVRTTEHALRITVSIGVASFRNELRAPEDLVKAADEALYAAKETGRNRVVVAPEPSEVS